MIGVPLTLIDFSALIQYNYLPLIRLSANGIISVQAGSAALTELLNLTAVHTTLKSVFPVVSPYQVDVPCFGGSWGFCFASLNLNPLLLSPTEVDNRISARSLAGLKFYDGLTHQGIFSLPRSGEY